MPNRIFQFLARRSRFSLRFVFVVMTILCCGLAYVSSVVHRRLGAIEQIRRSGGSIEFSREPDRFDVVPEWLQNRIGPKCFRKAHWVTINSRSDIELLGEFAEAQSVWLHFNDLTEADLLEYRDTLLRIPELGLNAGRLTDKSIPVLRQFPNLRQLNVDECELSNEALESLRDERPSVEFTGDTWFREIMHSKAVVSANSGLAATNSLLPVVFDHKWVVLGRITLVASEDSRVSSEIEIEAISTLFGKTEIRDGGQFRVLVEADAYHAPRGDRSLPAVGTLAVFVIRYGEGRETAIAEIGFAKQPLDYGIVRLRDEQDPKLKAIKVFLSGEKQDGSEEIEYHNLLR